jgi:hypothetical protein
MIVKYSKFNESIKNDIKQYDRVVTHGNLKRWDEDRGEFYINIEGQTGVVAIVQEGQFKMYGVVFDNYFSPILTDLEKRINIKRGLWISEDQLEKIETKKPKNEIPLSYSFEAKKVFSHCEFLYPLYLNIDYIDLTDKNDTISFITKERLDRLDWKEDQWDNNLRQEMKVGKFIQLINPHTNQKSLEKKINLFKAAYNGIILKKSIFKIVKGMELYKWYNEELYQEGTGSLNKSCMRNQPDRLTFYIKNPDKVSMLILINDEGKLEGRALIWKVDDPKIIYMDRIYTVYQEDETRFEEYANENNMKCYNYNQFDTMIVRIGYNIGPGLNNPYMDTFKYFYTKGECGQYYLSNKLREYDRFYELGEP